MKVQRVVANISTGNPALEVDDVDAALDKLTKGGFAIVYGPADEPWGVRRFFVRDPCGRLVNVLSHL